MKRTLDNFQEIGWLANNGHMLRVNTFAEVSISIIKQYEKEEEGRKRPVGYKTTMIFTSPRTQETLAIYERVYTTDDELLEALGIEDDEEVWEVLN